jgi:3-oxoacyl-[acyl-carrier protein] reductase
MSEDSVVILPQPSGAPTDPMTAKGCALVTGGSRGIGAAIARALAQDGWPVAVTYRADAHGAQETVAGIAQHGGRAVALAGDVTDRLALEASFASAEEQLGPVLVLVNNAGVRADNLSPLLEDDEWDRVLDTNLDAAFRASRRALKSMMRARFGRIVNIASIVGIRANPGQANYAAAKAGLIALTKTMAVEVARRGVTVNAIAPGLIDTSMTEDLDGRLLEAVPARRAGRPEDVAAAVSYLVSPAASYVTATTLVVDGGLSA